MKIIHLTHQQIDKQRWDLCIHNSINSKIYARSFYLNIVSPNWNALVFEDYSAVMPLTHNTKWGIKYLYQPSFCQQLGIFSPEHLTNEVLAYFLQTASKYYAYAAFYVNHHNTYNPQGVAIHAAKNYILNLSDSYECIRQGYTTDLIKKNLHRVKKFNLVYQSGGTVEESIFLYKTLYAHRTPHVKNKHYSALLQIATILHGSNEAFVRQVLLPGGEILASGLFLRDKNRIYNIASATTGNGRTLEANHFLLDQLIQEFAGISNLVFDFEGSEIPGIEQFYKKFGAVNEPYYFIKWNKLKWPFRLVKQ